MILRIFYVLFISITIVSCQQAERNDTDIDTAQSDSSSTQVTPAENPPLDSLAFIKDAFKRINSAKLDSTVYQFQCDERTIVKIYKEAGQIVKASIDWASVGDAYHYEEFYYHQNKLIFKYDLLEGTGAFEGADFKKESRSYVKNDQVFLFTLNGKTSDCKQCSFEENDKAYLVLKAKSEQSMKTALCR